MRLWSIHPSYLDTKGLLAVWREGLLALQVLSGKTKGYVHHPQLVRFKSHRSPIEAISQYLHGIVDEADARGYRFQREKLPLFVPTDLIPVTTGQLQFEIQHLKQKLKIRDKKKWELLQDIPELLPHSLFTLQQGEVEPWERIS